MKIKSFFEKKEKRESEIRRRPGLPKLFVVCILLWGILYSLVWIPFTAPDEYAHFATAYRVSNQLMGLPAENEKGEVLVRTDDTEELTISLSKEAYQTVYSQLFSKNKDSERMGYGHAAMEVANHAFLPQALGITIARLCSLGQVPAIYLGRLCNLLFFTLCGWLAIRLAPFGKIAFFGVSMLPMTLELVSSLSYDSFAIGMGMLFTAYVLHLIYEAPLVGVRQLLTLGILLALLAPCKMVYIPLALLCFLIPVEKFGSGKKFWAGAAVVAAFMTAGILLVNLDKILVYFQQTEDAIEWAEEAAGYSISYVLAHPLQTAAVFGRTLLQKGPTYISTMLGGTLGWLEYRTDEAVTAFLLVWILLTGLCCETKTDGIMPLSQRAVSWAACLLTVFLTMFFMLLSWTPLSSDVVEGVQGRYFLPVLPLALLTVRNRKIRTPENLDRILIGGFMIADFFVLFAVVTGI